MPKKWYNPYVYVRIIPYFGCAHTKKYYNYNNGTNSNNEEVTEDNKIVIFYIIDKNILKNEVFNQTTELKK